jgi:hypothetical protein
MTGDPTEVTLGEVARGLGRVEREMQAGFQAIKDEIKSLSFVPAAVYSADKVAQHDRMERLELDLEEEKVLRRDAEAISNQRAFQSRWSIILALVAMPISVIGSVLAALIVAWLK